MCSCWHCELADRLTARAEVEQIEAEHDALLCLALEQSARCDQTEGNIMTDPEFGLWIAHVANVLEDFHGAMDYDATADYAANLLRTYPDLLAMASQYQNGDAGREWLVDAVATAVQINTDCFCCPTCNGPLEDRGPFDGRLPNSGVTGGHEGFGETLMCEQGHWWAWLNGALIPPERILTIVERDQP